MEAEVDSFIAENMGLKLDQQLLYGTGVGNELAGVNSYAQTWSAGDFALSIKFPSIFDVLATGITQIQNSGANNFYNPNAILMNPTDVRKLGLEKDENGQYLIPMHLSGNGLNIEGIPIISTPLVVANTLFIGDFTRATIYTLRELSMEMANQHDTDFTSDLLTLKATLRKALVVKNQDKNAFLKVTDIEASKVALTKV
jgi:HK97 family phage major capsid protein